MDKIKQYLKDFNYKKSLKHIFLIVLGSVILAFGTGVLLVPFDIVTGGLSGVAIILDETFGWNVEIVVFILTWGFFFLGLIFLGKKFALKTLCSAIVYPSALSLCIYMQANIRFLQLDGTNQVHLLLAAIFGGACVGAGCAITFTGGGSTGGFDIPAFILQKYLKIKCSVGTFVLDALVIILALVVFQKLDLALIGILSAFICSLLIDKIFLGNSSNFVAMIVSSKWKEINNFIQTKTERGSTLIMAFGGYTLNEYRMIQITFYRNEYVDLLDKVYQIDPDAFISIMKAHAVNGLGFAKHQQKKTISDFQKKMKGKGK